VKQHTSTRISSITKLACVPHI